MSAVLLRNLVCPACRASELSLLITAFSGFFMGFASLLPSLLHPHRHLLYNCWVRGIAYQCAFLQPQYDLLFPVYLGKLDKAFDFTKVTYILVQIKNRGPGQGPCTAGTLAGPRLKFGTRPILLPEYLVLYLELGASVHFRETRTKTHLMYGKPQRHVKKKEAKRPPQKRHQPSVAASFKCPQDQQKNPTNLRL